MDPSPSVPGSQPGHPAEAAPAAGLNPRAPGTCREASASLLARLRAAPARARRVSVLLVAVMVFSLADLDMTLAYASSGGMIEANPLARAVMAYGSSKMLAVWKIASLVLCVGILFRARLRPSAEVATWVCFLALVWLSFRWEMYNEQMPHIAHTVLVDTGTELHEQLMSD